MDYVTLGHSGLKVSRACLGAMNFGTSETAPASEVDGRRIIDAFLDAGNNFIDTANVYTGGESEGIVGRAVASKLTEHRMASKASCRGHTWQRRRIDSDALLTGPPLQA